MKNKYSINSLALFLVREVINELNDKAGSSKGDNAEIKKAA